MRQYRAPPEVKRGQVAGSYCRTPVTGSCRYGQQIRVRKLQRSVRFRSNTFGVSCKLEEDEPDWNKEMSIFKQRMMRPNQLAVLRELESKVNVGKVQLAKDNLAIISGLNPDAPLGTKLSFVSGAVGVLLWHRSDDLAFALLLAGGQYVTVGEGVECKIKGVLQVIDESKGPITRKDYELFQAPAGDSLFGKAVDYLGRAFGSGADSPLQGLDKTRPILNSQVVMANREQINQSLLTGVKAVDILTPLGRGANLLIVGPPGSGKTTLALDAILGQADTGVRCVLALIGKSPEEVREVESKLEAGNARSNTAIVVCGGDASLGEKMATLSTACSIGERVRDEGGHSLVVLDDISCLSEVWETLVLSLVKLGTDKIKEGLIKDVEGRDVRVSPQSEEELVTYEGMLVSGAAAQRRGFFSTFFQRAAKMHRTGGAGSMSLLPIVPGYPATGTKKVLDMSKYQTLSEEQKARLAAALAAQSGADACGGEGCVPQETVEEYISISDGQVVLEPRPSPSSPYKVNPKLSITRIGSRAYYKALEALAPLVRLDLAQAEDARRFSMSPSDPVLQRRESYTQLMEAALQQTPGQPASLEEQVVLLFAIQRGLVAHVAPERLASFMTEALEHCRRKAGPALKELQETKQLTAVVEEGLMSALTSFVKSSSLL